MKNSVKRPFCLFRPKREKLRGYKRPGKMQIIIKKKKKDERDPKNNHGHLIGHDHLS